MGNSKRDDLVYMAKLAEQAEIYEDMVKNMKAVAELDEGLNVDERNLFSVAYKNVIGKRRESWKQISGIEAKESAKGNTNHFQLTRKFSETIENELKSICDEVNDILRKHLLNREDLDAESKVFFHKMVGDYYRYLAEVNTAERRQEAADKSLSGYEAAHEIANTSLAPTNAIRLGLALNSSVFHYEVSNNSAKACGLAKQAFDDAIAELDTLSEDSYRDSTLIMQLLRDNLTLWTSDAEGNQEQQSYYNEGSNAGTNANAAATQAK